MATSAYPDGHRPSNQSSTDSNAAQPFTAVEGVTGSAFQNTYADNSGVPVPLDQLQPRPQLIECPNCKQQAQTKVQGRSAGKTKFMNVFWWPLPNRKHWWEKTQWFCENCNYEVAMQKYGKDLEVN